MGAVDTLLTLAAGAAIGAFAASAYFGAKLAQARHGYIRVEAFDNARDKIEGLNAELRTAVQVAYNRGATEWARLNFPHWIEWLEESANAEASRTGINSHPWTKPRGVTWRAGMEVDGPDAGDFMAHIKFETHAQCAAFIDAMVGREARQ